MVRKIVSLLEEYRESHQNPTNKMVHWICVPAIFWTIAALIWSLPYGMIGINWLYPILGLVIVYYLIASWQLAVGIILYVAVCVWLIKLYEASFTLPLGQFAIGLFVIAWVGQFWGIRLRVRNRHSLKTCNSC